MENVGRQYVEDFIKEIEKSTEEHSSYISMGRQLDWNCYKVLITKTNHHGDIEYANEAFLKATGYQVYELINKPHSIVKHPDMPITIYEYMKNSLIESGQFACFIKIKTKDNNFFWVEEHCELREGEDGQLIYMKRYFVKPEIIEKEITPLYNNLRELERSHSIETASDYLKGYLATFSVASCKEMIEKIKLKYR